MAALHKIPFLPEVRSDFFSYVQKHELKEPRLVCKVFEAAVVSLLFDEILLTTRYADIEIANRIASRLGLFIKTLVVCSDIYSPVPWTIFPRKALDYFGTAQFFQPDKDDHLRRWWQNICKLIQEHDEIWGSGTFWALICQVFATTPSLHKIIITCVFRQGRKRMCIWGQAEPEGHNRSFTPRSKDKLCIMQVDYNTCDFRDRSRLDDKYQNP